jgi:ATP-dependent DNA ligase
MFKQQKAKTYGKDKIKDLTGQWYLSKKYDGHQVFIEKIGTAVNFYTSNHKQFNIEAIREPLSHLEEDFVLIGEYLYDCDGKLGSRATSTKVTTFRTNFGKGLENSKELEEKSKIMIFDCIPIRTEEQFNSSFRARIGYLQDLKLPKHLEVVSYQVVDIDTALGLVENWVTGGWEGGMLMQPNSPYLYGKRVHHAVKLKGRHTADLICVRTTNGTGKYTGLIGSLVLMDKAGRTVSVGSGLCDITRGEPPEDFIGKVIEIQYERIDETYIQPVYIGTRADKTKEEID